MAARSTSRTCSRSLPVTMRETSSRSSISRACARALRSMLSRPRARVASSALVERSTRAHPSTAFSGVRSSCDSVARNSSFSRLASRSRSSAATRSRFDALALVDFALQLGVGFRQLRRPIGDVVEHLVEGADDDADLVAGERRWRGASSRGVVEMRARRVRQIQERLGDRVAASACASASAAPTASTSRPRMMTAPTRQPAVHVAQVARQIERADGIVLTSVTGATTS